jgi:hypothetical protein
MRKLILICLSCLLVGTALAATITYRWNAVNNPVTVGGLPPKYLRLYYGPSLKNYTNHIDVLLSSVNTTNVYHGWDQYNCVWVDTSNYVEAKVTGLVLSQQIFSAYSVINSNGQESPYINESTCGFTVTNNSDAVVLSAPKNLRLK